MPKSDGKVEEHNCLLPVIFMDFIYLQSDPKSRRIALSPERQLALIDRTI